MFPMKDKFTSIIGSITTKSTVFDLAYHVLNDIRFYHWSGSGKPEHHHYGTEGLWKHTLEVIELCMKVAETYPQHNLNKEYLFLAALFHDYGKIWDYKQDTNNIWVKGSHCRYIHHISRSAIEWSLAKNKYSGFDDKDEVLHAILAHHGFREWGSPVAPASRVAFILHYCDAISARVDDCDRHDVVKG
jgi:3'-5' exoribonuclease